MTRVAGIGNLVLVRHFRCDEVESVTADIDVCNCLLDVGHVARYAVVAWTAGAMMRMGLDRRRVRTVL